MMKLFLGLSLLINLILGYFLVMRKPEKEIVERVIIETHAQKQDKAPKTPPPVKTEKKAATESTKNTEPEPAFLGFGPSEFQDAGEKMEVDRTEFFVHKLGMSEEKIAEHNRLRMEFFQETSKMWPKKAMREPTFEERRKLIDLEEDFHKKLEKLHGKKNWERYQKYREDYNEKGFKLQNEENRPFIFMGI